MPSDNRRQSDHRAAADDAPRDDALEAAIAQDRIAIVFQPQVDPASSAVLAVEALVRWADEEDTTALFARAERAGLGERLSRHAQRKAIAMAARWTGALDGLHLSINLAAEELARASYVDWLLHELSAQRLAPQRLTVELTESAALHDVAAAAERLERLRAAGVRIALDDVGTGYANLAWLAQLPLDAIKIDRGLVAQMNGDKGRILVRSLIDLARALGVASVVEGVETLGQHALVSEWGCDLVQGFLAAGALDEAELARFVAVSRRAAA